MSKRLTVWVPIYTDRDGSLSGGPGIAWTRKWAILEAKEQRHLGYVGRVRIAKFVEVKTSNLKKT